MQEAEFRSKIQSTFDSIERAFENVDPDLAECTQSQGSLTIQFADQSKCILSVQPSVRQLWVAIASKGRALHMHYDSIQNDWVDAKGEGHYLKDLMKDLVKQVGGVSIEL